MTVRIKNQGHTLRSANHKFENETCLPDTSSRHAIEGALSASYSMLMQITVSIKTEITSHRYYTDYAHPRAEEITSLRRRFSCLEQKQQSLNRTKSRYIEKTVNMSWAQKGEQFTSHLVARIRNQLVAMLIHLSPFAGSVVNLPAHAKIVSRSKGEIESRDALHCR